MAIFVRFSNGDLAHQITSERETAQRIRVVVSLSVNKSGGGIFEISL